MSRYEAKPDGESRFQPEPYRLNWERIHEIPAVLEDGKESRETTVGAILRRALPGHFTDPNAPEGQEPSPLPEAEETALGLTLEIRTALGETIRLDASGDGRFGSKLVEKVLQLIQVQMQTGLEPYLFYFAGGDWHYDETSGERCRFFVVAGDKIVIDDFELRTIHGVDNLDSSVLESLGMRNDAWLKWWYRRFYTETMAGQLIVLGDGWPPVYHYSPPEFREAERDLRLRAILGHLTRLEILLFLALAVWLVRGCFGQ